ncbi:TetR/AcrR family transcriptional regulator [Amycolatopsis azurea]|uniref:TetR family transcriptional regulator n=1 Tax=Amycolatopsis azurea DSM 43854 TaxID=1238180 RepID=M2QG64_9PSEU|nr:TetR/AcrR family transcriptional regulator [Amycolatopsis azurea]EMD25731.1 Transcriptional regulator, TetR family [Amycolatopsis azurea DSM 43854]OOC02609.1 TetR family transcriptional regulator [Amycolatopsis azurea DSM 43854]
MQSEKRLTGLTFIEQARRRQILDGAAQVIVELGYANASLVRIGEAIGSSKGGVLYHFPDKNALVGALVLDIYQRGAATIAAAVREAGDSAGARLRAYILANLAFTASHRIEAMALVELSSGYRSPDGRRLDEVMRHWLEDPGRSTEERAELAALDLVPLVRQGVESGEFRASLDPDSVATALRGAVDAAASRWARDPGFDPEAYGRELADFADHACRRVR